MNEGSEKDDLDFARMSDEELLEIVNPSSGGFRQELVQGARNELEKRGRNNVRAESNSHVMGGVPPPVSVENVSGRKLFSTGQITLASFLGTPLAGCLLIAQNYRALGVKGSAWQPLVIGFAATILLIILALFLPENFPNLGLPGGSCLGMYFYAKQQQGDVLDNHLKAGGRKGSWGALIAVSLGCVVISLILLVAIVAVFDIKLSGDETTDRSGQVSQVW